MTKSGWYYDKRELKQTPSIHTGLTFEQETSYRREGARFIIQVGNKMGLRYETMATGVVYFHRFYMVHTFQEFPRHVTACCCLFLAGKVEETPKKCRDIMKTAKALMDEITWAEFGTDPREEVMTLERILLQTIKFDFIVEHPYSYLLKYAKGLKGDKKKLPHMVQMAWTFVNDSLCTTLCLQWEPEIIAIALMYLAGKLSKFDVTDWIGRTPKQEKWWEMYVSGITTELLEDICHQVLDLYSPNRGEGGSGIGHGSGSGSSKIAGLGSSKGASIISGKTVSSNLSAGAATNSASASGSASSSVSGTTPSAGSSSNSNNVDPSLAVPTSSQKRAVTPTKAGGSQPPAKKAKKEEVKSSPAKPSPAKQEPSNPPQPYPYSYPSYSNYPPSYPPSQSSTSGSSSSTAPRYPPYTYPATTTQGPPPPAQVPPQVPPPSYQPPQRHYPPPTAAAPQAPPHYTNQPPPSHYPSSSHPSYHPPPTTSHYAAPPPTNYPPPSHGSSSSYYPPPPSASNPPPNYPQTAPSSSYPPPSSYSHSHPHSSSRSYYPPP